MHFKAGEGLIERSACNLAQRLSPVRTVSTSSRPRPGISSGSPRSLPDRRCGGRASDSRRRCPGPFHRADDAQEYQCPSLVRASPSYQRSWLLIRAGRSAHITGDGLAWRYHDQFDQLSALIGSRSSKLAIRGMIGQAIFRRPAVSRAVRSSTTASSLANGQWRAARAPRHSLASPKAPRSADNRRQRAPDRAKLVDEKTPDHRRVVRVNTPSCQQCSNDAAAIDIADQHDWHTGSTGKAHVGDVACPQVDLRRQPAPARRHRTAPAAGASFP